MVNTRVVVGAAAVAGALYLAQQQASADTGQPIPFELPLAAPRTPTTNGGALIVIEPTDQQHHLDAERWTILRDRMQGCIAWVEDEAAVSNTGPLTLDVDIEPHYVSAPWTRAELRAIHDDPDQEAAFDYIFPLLADAGFAPDHNFLGVSVPGLGGFAGAWLESPNGILPPTFLVGDCVLDAWLGVEPDYEFEAVCEALQEPQWSGTQARTPEGQMATWIHELGHIVGKLGHEPGTVMFEWWNFPDTILNDAQIAAIAEVGYIL